MLNPSFPLQKSTLGVKSPPPQPLLCSPITRSHPVRRQKSTRQWKAAGRSSSQTASARASQGFNTGQAGKAAPASLTKSPANAPGGTQPALRGRRLCPGVYSSPSSSYCQGAFHGRHQRACIPRWPGLAASVLAANYWQQSCRGDGERAPGCHLPGPNDVGLRRLQPQLGSHAGEKRGNQPQTLLS